MLEPKATGVSISGYVLPMNPFLIIRLTLVVLASLSMNQTLSQCVAADEGEDHLLPAMSSFVDPMDGDRIYKDLKELAIVAGLNGFTEQPLIAAFSCPTDLKPFSEIVCLIKASNKSGPVYELRRFSKIPDRSEIKKDRLQCEPTLALRVIQVWERAVNETAFGKRESATREGSIFMWSITRGHQQGGWIPSGFEETQKKMFWLSQFENDLEGLVVTEGKMASVRAGLFQCLKQLEVLYGVAPQATAQ